MKRVFWDANVLLDLIDHEREHHAAAVELLALMGKRHGQCLCSWGTLSVIDYVGGKKFGSDDIWDVLREIVREFIIPATGSEAAQAAFQYLSGDYEDTMQIAAAMVGKADCIVTRDQRGFANCPIPVFSATECLAQMKASKL
jgi:predicted nucleic acid-binding protein